MKMKKLKGFTLIEMLVVLIVISVLLLLFVPNLAGTKESAEKQGDAAVVKVVETQLEVYRLDTGKTAVPEDLVGEYITADQLKIYRDKYPKSEQ
ncbi:type II secretion system protein G [Enterococcus canis]|uniref:Type II secretion system protein G n=1 Tax=Enterococcus canis TaxID=214095 RepID=A0A1L8RG99_9ENTE|nr:competence type IV pilus major pilin ComGC [Enterococcus canis]OJG18790.1 type II secretion system protein G [Enterococcus canis]